MTDKEIHRICERYDIQNYTINLDGYNIDYNKLVTNQKLDKIIRKDKIKRIKELL